MSNQIENQGKINLSIIIPVLNEEENLQTLYDRLTSSLARIKKSYELIFVDDGSSDGTRSLFDEYRTNIERMRYFRLSRGFGLEIAIECGMEQAIGDVAVVLRPECDPPSLIPSFVEK
ncbi:MAG: glycosyltransferase, partial [Candidatus Poribacteria bacterium]